MCTTRRPCLSDIERVVGFRQDLHPYSANMTDETRKDNGLGLADVLQHLGGELREAQRRGGGTIAWMSAEVEMELAVETTGSGTVKFWVVSGDASRAHTRATRIKVTLTPHSDNEQHYGVGM